jgi:hypothetical protein
VVAHATGLRLIISPAVSHLRGGKGRRSMRSSSNSQRRLKLAEALPNAGAFMSTAIPARPGEREGEHLARRGCSPPVFPLLFPSNPDR